MRSCRSLTALAAWSLLLRGNKAVTNLKLSNFSFSIMQYLHAHTFKKHCAVMLKWAEGYPAVVVHGPLTAILLMELVRTRAPDRYCLRVSSPGAALRPRPLLPDRHAGRGTRVPGGARARWYDHDDRW